MATPNSNRSLLGRTVGFVVIGGGICLAPFVVLALVALSYLGLRGDADILREQVFAATPAGWSTKVQVNVGESTLEAAGFGLRFVQHDHIDQAREAIAAVKRASVGVYKREAALDEWSRTELFAHADQAMEKRGWTRWVGVTHENSTVLVYGPQRSVIGESVDVCVAVINEKNLVIASAKLNAEALDELIRANGFDNWREKSPFLAQN